MLWGSLEQHFIISALILTSTLPKAGTRISAGITMGLELHGEFKHHSAASLKDGDVRSDIRRWSSPMGTGQSCGDTALEWEASTGDGAIPL